MVAGVEKREWVQQYSAVFFALNADNQVVGWQFCRNLRHVTLQLLLKRFAKRGTVSTVYTDQCCHDRNFLQRIFGPHVKVFLDTFHFKQRLRRALSTKHFGFGPAMMSLKKLWGDDRQWTREEMISFMDNWEAECHASGIWTHALADAVVAAKKHINNGCLDKHGAGTQGNENLHKHDAPSDARQKRQRRPRDVLDPSPAPPQHNRRTALNPPSQPDNVQQPADNVQQPADNVQQPADNVQQPPDNVQQPPDNLQQPPDNLQQTPDNVQQPPDNLQQPPDNLQPPPDNLHQHPASQPAPQPHTLQDVPLQRSPASQPASTMHPAFLLQPRAPYPAAAPPQIPPQALPPNLLHPNPLQAPLLNFADPLQLQMQLQALTYLQTFGNPNHRPP